MAILPGTRLGVYEVTSLLGEGGMGQVYRARDTKLDRDVALKILPESFAHDPDRLMRFEREAKTLASLNHPNIAAIYGLEESALVMELVEGEDLSQRIARGPIPLDEALPIAKQIAEALEAAHEQGIIHRDLKPANVKVRLDGTVKVLDFGLAKALAIDDPKTSSLQQTITSPAMTMHGVILGTAAYMSPEQAKGKPVDRRADNWAFGCVLYEMLTGNRTFAGEDISDTLASVLRDDPRWVALPAGTPSQVRTLLRRCLQKDPQKRLPHIGAARLDLAEAGAGDSAVALPPPRSGRVSAAMVGAAIGAIVVAAIVFALRRPPESTDAKTQVRFAIEPAPGSSFPGGNQVPRFAVSPDGTTVVYQQQDARGSHLWVRALDSVAPRPLTATANTGQGGLAHQQPFWSPDGRFIAYFDEPAQQLKKLNLQTGAVQALAKTAGNQLSGAWNDAGVILFSSIGSRGLQRVPAEGGTAAPATTLDAGTRESAHLWPDFLPDGKHFVYLAIYENEAEPALFVGSLDGGSPKRLFASPVAARVAWPDRLLFVRDAALVSQRFDLTRLEMTGAPSIVVNDIPYTTGGRLGVSASRTGVLVHSDGSGGVEANESAWVDRNGRAIQPAPPPVEVGFSGIRLSPDGTRLIYGRTAAEPSGRRLNELWIQDVARGIESRLTTEPAVAGFPAVFSRDGSHVWFRRAGSSIAVVDQVVSGAVPAEVVIPLTGSQQAFPHDVSVDGSLLYSSAETNRLVASDPQMLVLPPGPGQTPVPYLKGVFAAYGAAFSPDGRWVAYATGSTLLNRQVFIQPFPDAGGGKWAISGAGGGFPRWRGDGRELYFSSGRQLMAVPVSTIRGLEVGVPAALFELESMNVPYQYDVSADGQRFVVLRNRGAGETPVRLIVTVDWLRSLDTLAAGAQQ